MLRHCLFCHTAFPGNQTLEWLPVGRRIALDPERGRLWCICTACQGWTLQPIEQRWEALEELERLISTRATLLRQGENIALLRAADLELVRIGRAPLQEEAWWRYGDELARRHNLARALTRRGKIIGALTWTALLGVPIWTEASGQWWLERARRKTLGQTAWSGLVHCAQCGRERTQLRFSELRDVHVLGDLSAPALHLPCTCQRGAGARLTGVPATYTLRRLLTHHNFAGATRLDVQRAAHAIETAENSAAMLDRILPMHRSLAVAQPADLLTLEMAINHDSERQWLEMEIRELEARWRAEEEIAAIVDRELT